MPKDEWKSAKDKMKAAQIARQGEAEMKYNDALLEQSVRSSSDVVSALAVIATHSELFDGSLGKKVARLKVTPEYAAALSAALGVELQASGVVSYTRDALPKSRYSRSSEVFTFDPEPFLQHCIEQEVPLPAWAEEYPQSKQPGEQTYRGRTDHPNIRQHKSGGRED